MMEKYDCIDIYPGNCGEIFFFFFRSKIEDFTYFLIISDHLSHRSELYFE